MTLAHEQAYKLLETLYLAGFIPEQLQENADAVFAKDTTDEAKRPLDNADYPVVRAEDRPPAGKDDHCFWCHEAPGTRHAYKCTTVNRKVKVRAVVEYEVEVPRSWDKGMIEFHRNDGSWCADNALDEIKECSEGGCLCYSMEFEYLGEVKA